ncbi:trans-resveratrol di-O-methyltransferase [Dorcoceras hygrometricum]|uniref:Trans-resveratrol di-O-methyltransferase n=1 Tax=Dorcoceras hygrometricum TaxID=472368 RepID=A0A2Z7D4B5_9LAMI|nr:trans-resveratrol di-O-methyltransferase [Dorcoceras hygrometricum]
MPALYQISPTSANQNDTVLAYPNDSVSNIELLVQLRERVIDEVDRFFNSFSLKNLANLMIEDIYEKEGQVLSWAETDSTRMDLQRKMNILLLHIRDLEKKVNARFDEHDRAYRALLTNILKDMHDHKTARSLDVVKSQQRISTQVVAAAFDTVDVRKEVKELNAKVTDLDGHVATIRSELLDFRAKEEENHLNLSTQLGFLVDCIRRGDAKKGEGGSSRPQPPPDDQNRQSGGSGNRADVPRKYGGGTVSRESGSRGISGSGESWSRGDISGSSKRRRSSGGESPIRGITYGPYLPSKRSAPYWLYGERDF